MHKSLKNESLILNISIPKSLKEEIEDIFKYELSFIAWCIFIFVSLHNERSNICLVSSYVIYSTWLIKDFGSLLSISNWKNVNILVSGILYLFLSIFSHSSNSTYVELSKNDELVGLILKVKSFPFIS